MLINSYYQQDLKSLRFLSFYCQVSFSASTLSYFFLGHSTFPYHVSEPTYASSLHKSSSNCGNYPSSTSKRNGSPHSLTIIQTAKHIILWSRTGHIACKNHCFLIEFRLYKPVKTPLNQCFSSSSAGRAPP